MILSAKWIIPRCSTDRGIRPTVNPLLSVALALVFGILGSSHGFAQDRTSVGSDSTAAPTTIDSLTGKERLGPKWTDEQRIDNCKIPTDKQGARPRSSACPHIPTG
jgi:hypothetical protein